MTTTGILFFEDLLKSLIRVGSLLFYASIVLFLVLCIRRIRPWNLAFIILLIASIDEFAFYMFDFLFRLEIITFDNIGDFVNAWSGVRSFHMAASLATVLFLIVKYVHFKKAWGEEKTWPRN